MYKARRGMWVLALVGLAHLGLGAWWLTHEVQRPQASNSISSVALNSEQSNAAQTRQTSGAESNTDTQSTEPSASADASTAAQASAHRDDMGTASTEPVKKNSTGVTATTTTPTNQTKTTELVGTNVNNAGAGQNQVQSSGGQTSAQSATNQSGEAVQIDCSATLKSNQTGAGLDVWAWVVRTGADGSGGAKLVRLVNQAGSGSAYINEIKSAASKIQFTQRAAQCSGVQVKVRIRVTG